MQDVEVGKHRWQQTLLFTMSAVGGCDNDAPSLTTTLLKPQDTATRSLCGRSQCEAAERRLLSRQTVSSLALSVRSNPVELQRGHVEIGAGGEWRRDCGQAHCQHPTTPSRPNLTAVQAAGGRMACLLSSWLRLIFIIKLQVKTLAMARAGQ